MSNDEHKLCPFCREEIRLVAVKCKHCKSDLCGGEAVRNKASLKQEHDTEPVVTVEHRCPKCKAFLQEGVTLCGNCKAQLVWKDGQPRLTTSYAIQQTGCALTSIGCLLPILIAIILFIVMIVAM